MKRIMLLSACFLCWALPAHAAESIPSFTTVVEVRDDSTLRVTETVVYDMDTVLRHGLERIIPKQSQQGPRIVITDVSALRDGREDRVNLNDSSDELVIRIGEPDITISGTHTYELSYTVLNEVRYFDDRDEVYWNAIPNGMRLPIGEASAIVHMPVSAVLVGVPACYTGPDGSQQSDCQLSVDGASVTATANRPFAVGEGMSVAVAVAPGSITRVAPVEEDDNGIGFGFLWASGIAGVLAVFILGVLCMLFVKAVGSFWKMMSDYNRLPGRRSDGGDIIVQYDPPPGCSAPEAAYMSGPVRAGRMFTAAVVQLAVQKWLSMEFTHKKKFFGTETEITFRRVREGSPDDPTLQQVMDSLFQTGPERTLSDLREKARDGAVQAVQIAAGIPLIFLRRGWLQRRGWFGVLTGYTESGRSVKEHLAGLKIYMSAAEKERLEFHNAPSKSPETFEKLLPYAIAMGVDEPWTKSFGDLQYVPEWVTGDTSLLGTVALADSIGDLSSGIGSVMNAFASGTDSGGGGGGSSGGGGGGGGGGGW